MVVLKEIVVDRFRHMEAAKLVTGRGSLLADDAAGVRRVVAADIEEIADVVAAAAFEDLLAIGLVRLVAGRAERGGGCARDRLELGLVDLREIEQPLGTRLHQPAHAVAHAEDAADLARSGEP